MAGPTEFVPTSSLGDALVILGAAGLVIPRITPVIGFILVGLMVGPFGLGQLVDSQPWLAYVTISDPAGLGPFAEFGIILLLFSIGLELSFSRLWQMRRQVFGLGSLEMIFCSVIIATGLVLIGRFRCCCSRISPWCRSSSCSAPWAAETRRPDRTSCCAPCGWAGWWSSACWLPDGTC